MSGTSRSMIEATQISKNYTRGDNSVAAIRDVSFTIPEGTKVSILGKSGSGKSTLLNLLAGLDRASSGKLTVQGLCLTSCSGQQLDNYRQKTIGIVFQQFRLIRHRTASQNVEFPLILSRRKPVERKQIVLECLEKVGLANRADHFPSELSGGEQQRVAIARAMVNRPSILLADEPTGNLDSANAENIMELLDKLHQETRTTMILVTHDEQLASDLTDNLVRLADGRIVENSIQLETGACAVGEDRI